ncbi:MAG: rRNA maturation RNase YbeY [Anaerolineales bacterium]|nr:rRNA maturation RNase YbeY [Anaerolineales bacterium]
MDIIFQIDEPFPPHVEPDRIEQALQLTLDQFNRTAGSNRVTANSVTVVVTDNELVQQLNAQYRSVDAPTDVLSFENTPDPDFPELDEAAAGHLGDIIIAYPVAEAQALAGGHRPSEEITLLAVHGFLHLLGFDHDTPDHKQAMWAIQKQVMAHLGLAHVQPTET